MKYLIRSVKYFAALCVFCAVVIYLNRLAGSLYTVEQTLYLMFHTTRGALLPVAVVVLAALYPWIGFTVRKLEGDVVNDRRQIDTAFEVAGYQLRREEGGVMYWRASSWLRRLTMLFEDEVTVRQSGETIVVDGNRRGVARVDYQLRNYLANKRRNEA